MKEYGVINVSVSTHYSEPSSTSAVTTQGLLGEKVTVIEVQSTHIKICQEDGYISWIPEDQLILESLPGGEELLVRHHFVPILAAPSPDSIQLRDAVIGCKLQVTADHDDWYQVVLPDGISGWIKKNSLAAMSQFSVESILSLAHEFIGYQYFWGGISPKGFDCSGFVQTVYRLHNVQLPRDSWQQQQQGFLSSNHLDAQPGDLLFFSSQPDKVTHVAISLGDQQYIHASGWVRLDSFRESDEIFNKQRLDQFTSVNRYSL